MLRIFESEDEVAEEIAKEMREYLFRAETPVFCLASGSTPKKSYRRFADDLGGEERLKSLRIVSLDEWVGVPQSAEGSCYQMLEEDLFSLIGLSSSQIEFFDGTSKDLQQECLKIDRFIEKNPITFSLMGVGMNGHIGLNEPGSPVLNRSSIVDLSETTKKVAQKYFNKPTNLEKGITLGLEQVANSARVIVAITGDGKAEIAREIFFNPKAKLPAQALLDYDHIDFFLDLQAARYIKLQ